MSGGMTMSLDDALAGARAAGGGGGGNFTLSNGTTSLPIQYTPPDLVLGLSQSPRFGHSSNFVDLLGGSGGQAAAAEQRTDYLMGVMFGGIIVLSVYVLWCCVLLFFMVCGKAKAGFLSGKPFEMDSSKEAALILAKHDMDSEVMPATPTELASPTDNELYNAQAQRDMLLINQQEEQDVLRTYSSNTPSCNNRPTRIRTLFLLAGAVFVSFSVLIVTEGFANLQTTIDVFERSADEVNTLSVEGLDVIENGFLKAGRLAQKVKSAMSSQLDDPSKFCPAHPDLEDIAPQATEMRQQAMDAVSQIDEISYYIDTTVQQVADSLQEARDNSEMISAQLNKIDLTDWKALVALIPFSIVPALLMAGALLALFDSTFKCYTCFINWFLCPVFVVLVAITWIIAALMIISAAMNGDFCLPGGRVGDLGIEPIRNNMTTFLQQNPPDYTVLELLKQQGFEPNTDTYDVAAYYISQCTNEQDPFTLVRHAQPQLEQGSTALLDVEQLFNSDSKALIDALALYCERDFEDIEILVQDLQSLVLLLMQSISTALNLLSCQRIVPLYAETVYMGVCTYTPTAVFWVFASCLVMGVMGMIMLTTRASYKRTYYTIPDPASIANAADGTEAAQTSTRQFDNDDEVGAAGAAAVGATTAGVAAAGLAAQADSYSVDDDVDGQFAVNGVGSTYDDDCYDDDDIHGFDLEIRNSGSWETGACSTDIDDSLQFVVNDETTTVGTGSSSAVAVVSAAAATDTDTDTDILSSITDTDTDTDTPSSIFSLPKGPSRSIPRPPSGYDQEAGRRFSSTSSPVPEHRLSALMG